MAWRHDVVSLTVLAMLSAHASHPYELNRMITETHKDYVTGLPRSLYHAVQRLAKDELIVPVHTSRDGRRPERTVYEITEEGRQELASRLRTLLELPDRDRMSLIAAVSLIGVLPVAQALRALRTRMAALEGRVAGLEAHTRTLTEGGLPGVLILKLEYQRALDIAELQWVHEVIDRLDAGRLTWPDGRQVTVTAAHASLHSTRRTTPPKASGVGLKQRGD